MFQGRDNAINLLLRNCEASIHFPNVIGWMDKQKRRERPKSQSEEGCPHISESMWLGDSHASLGMNVVVATIKLRRTDERTKRQTEVLRFASACLLVCLSACLLVCLSACLLALSLWSLLSLLSLLWQSPSEWRYTPLEPLFISPIPAQPLGLRTSKLLCAEPRR